MHFLHKSITKDIPKNSFVNAFCSRVIVRMMGLGRSAEGRRDGDDLGPDGLIDVNGDRLSALCNDVWVVLGCGL